MQFTPLRRSDFEMRRNAEIGLSKELNRQSLQVWRFPKTTAGFRSPDAGDVLCPVASGRASQQPA
ncbi:MAG: hypothetical protein WCD46_04945, partial [Desulfobacterales bacterium]